MRLRATYSVILVAAWLLGAAWAVSSPEGSSPDDNFHLASIWCQTGNDDACVIEDGELPELSAQVPLQLLTGNCYYFQSNTSAACALVSDSETTESTYFNAGLYPPTFYAVMSVFVGPEVWRSVVAMRLAAMTASLLVLALAAWASPDLRRSQVVAWSVAAIPLWMFVMPSTNPSSWAIAGVAAMWPAAYALLHARGGKQVVLAVAAVLAAAVLSTARGDSAAMALAVLGLTTVVHLRGRAQVPAVLGAAAVGLALGLVFLGSSQTESLTTGLPGTDLGSGVQLLWSNILNLPDLWLGAFGARFSLGWFDTFMPSLAWFPALSAASGLVLLGLYRLGVRKGLLLAAVGGMLVTLPLVMLQLSSAPVGSQVQPRYLLPLVVVFIGIAMAPLDHREIALSTAQRWILTVGCVLATSISLHVQLRRYITGQDVSSPNLDASIEWWALTWLGPMAVWILGTVAAAALYFAAFTLLARVRDPERERAFDHGSAVPDAGRPWQVT